MAEQNPPPKRDDETLTNPAKAGVGKNGKGGDALSANVEGSDEQRERALNRDAVENQGGHPAPHAP